MPDNVIFAMVLTFKYMGIRSYFQYFKYLASLLLDNKHPLLDFHFDSKAFCTSFMPRLKFQMFIEKCINESYQLYHNFMIQIICSIG